MINIHRLNQKLISDKAVRFLVGELAENLKEGKKILLLLSGGSAVELYKVFSSQFSIVSSDKIAIAQVDERFQPDVIASEQPVSGELGDPLIVRGLLRRPDALVGTSRNDTNAEAIGKTGLWKWCEKKKIPFFTISQEGSLEDSAGKYDAVIARLFNEYDYKIAVLGIGEDGHTAGLIPGYREKWNLDNYAVGYEMNNNQNSKVKIQKSKLKMKFRERITITPWALRQIDQAVIVITGKNKEKALGMVLDRKNRGNLDKFPAVILQETKRVDIFQGEDIRGI